MYKKRIDFFLGMKFIINVAHRGLGNQICNPEVLSTRVALGQFSSGGGADSAESN
jgi:hypothetical protein